MNRPAVFSFLESYGPNTIYNTLRLQTHSCNIERGVLESSEKHVLSSACFSRLRLLRFDQSSLAMEEVLIQGDTAGAAASPPCPFDAARREPPLPRHAATVLAPAWRSPVGAAAPVRGA